MTQIMIILLMGCVLGSVLITLELRELIQEMKDQNEIITAIFMIMHNQEVEKKNDQI